MGRTVNRNRMRKGLGRHDIIRVLCFKRDFEVETRLKRKLQIQMNQYVVFDSYIIGFAEGKKVYVKRVYENKLENGVKYRGKQMTRLNSLMKTCCCLGWELVEENQFIAKKILKKADYLLIKNTRGCFQKKASI